jgi:hypothetical protein
MAHLGSLAGWRGPKKAFFGHHEFSQVAKNGIFGRLDFH